MWWWRKVRHARLPQELRDRFEVYGETVLALMLTTGQPNVSFQGVELLDLVRQKRSEIVAWLQERRDLAERREQRLETSEWAILIFVVAGVITDAGIFAHEFGWLR